MQKMQDDADSAQRIVMKQKRVVRDDDENEEDPGNTINDISEIFNIPLPEPQDPALRTGPADRT
jgi:hypothetical protein